MTAIRMIPMILVIFAMVGCATTKPEMSSEDYVKYSKAWVVVHGCNTQGYLDSDTSATGLRYIQANVNSYAFNQNTMDENIKWTANKVSKPTLSECREMGLQVHKKKQQIQINNDTVETEQQFIKELNNTRSRQTYCNKIGTQVLCTTN